MSAGMAPLAALAQNIGRQEGPMDKMGRMVQLRSLLDQRAGMAAFRQEQTEKLEQQRLEAARMQRAQQLWHQAYREAEGNPEKVIKRARELGVDPKFITDYEGALEKTRKDYAARTKDELEVLTKQKEARANIVGSFLRNIPEDQRVSAYPMLAKSLAQSGVPAEMVPKEYPGDETASMIAMELDKDLDRAKYELELKKFEKKETKAPDTVVMGRRRYQWGGEENGWVDIGAAPEREGGEGRATPAQKATLERWLSEQKSQIARAEGMLSANELDAARQGITPERITAEKQRIQEQYDMQAVILGVPTRRVFEERKKTPADEADPLGLGVGGGRPGGPL